MYSILRLCILSEMRPGIIFIERQCDIGVASMQHRFLAEMLHRCHSDVTGNDSIM